MDINVKISGITPLICNAFGDEAAQASTDGVRSSVATTDRGTPQEIAESKLYKDLKGKLCIPQPNLLRCIVDGGSYHKIGKKQVTTKKESMLYSCVDISGVTIPLIHSQPWKVDTRPVRIPATGGRILRHRPMFDDWSLEFVIELDTSMLTPKLMRQIVDDAGKRIGLGDFRPTTKGPFGKFRVDAWVEKKEALRKAA